MHYPSHTRRYRKPFYLLAIAAVCAFFLCSCLWQDQLDGSYEDACRLLPGVENVLVSLKTGATEVDDKFEIHSSTTLRCYPQHLVFSDHEDFVNFEPIIDALEHVSPSIKESHDDFHLWRRLRHIGKDALLPSELSGTDSREKDESLRIVNPGWKLDKWKFLPMMNQTLHRSNPDIHWFVFVEADTYLLWSSLLAYLDTMEWTRPYYLGSELVVENTTFAHGGSGFALSRPALEQVVDLFCESQHEWEDFTDRYWAGDHILGVALLEAGIPLEPSWPSWQGQDVGHVWWEQPFRSPRLWCEIAVSYHHESPAGIEDLWNFEQDWIQQSNNPIRHKDVFEKFIIPRIQRKRSSWDNNSGASRGSVASLSECEAICEKEAGCLQYSLRMGNECTTTTEPFLGDVAEGVDSGWMPERFQQYFDSREPCY